MTAEIALMNKHGIALAADSAITASHGEKTKIWQSANKIFTLSKYQPIGIMIYGDAELMHIPWETIVKVYREELGDKKFNTVKEYGLDFLRYISKNMSFFPEEIQERHFKEKTWKYLTSQKSFLDDSIIRIINGIGAKRNKIKKIKDTINDHFEKIYNRFMIEKQISTLPPDYERKLKKKYTDTVSKIIDEVFKDISLKKALKKKLTYIIFCLFTKEILERYFAYSGIVIAGFGEREFFPSLISFLVEGIVENHLKYKEDTYKVISVDTTASIVPFAQKEMVFTFIYGVSGEISHKYDTEYRELINKFGNSVVDIIESINPASAPVARTTIDGVTKNLLDEANSNIDNFINKFYKNPVLDIIEILQKNDLAIMAESLVNLTVLKHKVSMGFETVGEPVDVAVISKGDGFIWIKRKQYFDKDLNHHFKTNYFRKQNERKK